MNDFRECNIDTNKPIEYETFKKWLYRDHNLYISYANKNLVIATSLTCLDEIGFTNDTKSNPNTQQQQFASYPSFSK